MRLIAALLLALLLLPAAARADVDRILVEKAAHRMTLLEGDRVVKTYKVALGKNPTGHKEREGDNRTPEGLYKINGRNERSGYHRALWIDYPSAADRKAAASKGVPPGGDIMIHGLRNGFGWIGTAHTATDWTAGCIALTNAEIEEVWSLVKDGTTIEIRP